MTGPSPSPLLPAAAAALSWDLCRSALAVLRQGSLSAAARSLGLTQPTLGRHMEELQQVLGQSLFTRSPAGLVPTALALTLRPHLEAMESAAAALTRAAAATEDPEGRISGVVRVTCSEPMGVEILPQILAPLAAAHPALEVELAVTTRTEDLLRRDADLAVRNRRPEQQALLARKLGKVELQMYATEAYLQRHGIPQSVADVERPGHRLIGFDRDQRAVRSVAGDAVDVDRIRFTWRTDSIIGQIAAIRAGIGLGVVQEALARRHPELQRVLPGFAIPMEFWLAMHEDLKTNPAARLVWTCLGEGLSQWLRE